MTALPIVSNFESDFVLQLVEVEEADSMDSVAEKCAHHSIGRRVAPRPGTILRVRLQDADAPFPREQTVAGAGIAPMDTIEIFFEPVVAEA
jgi:toluene monooxygenase system protein B